MPKPVAPTPLLKDAEISPVVQRMCRLLLRLFGWRIETWAIPYEMDKIVAIGEHHTSNWDGVMLILMITAMGRRFRWLVKKELDKPVLGAFIRLTGGLFIDRNAAKGTVAQVMDTINESDRISSPVSGRHAQQDRSLENRILLHGNRRECSGRAGLPELREKTGRHRKNDDAFR